MSIGSELFSKKKNAQGEFLRFTTGESRSKRAFDRKFFYVISMFFLHNVRIPTIMESHSKLVEKKGGKYVHSQAYN